MVDYVVGTAPINLTQVLKGANLAESGGQAKAMIADGLVRVNGEIEIRKRRKMTVGDVIEVEGMEGLRLVADGPGDQGSEKTIHR